MTYRELARRLRELGCQEVARRSGGSHRTWHNPVTDQLATVPDWGHKDLKLGTVRAIIAQLGLDWQHFRQG